MRSDSNDSDRLVTRTEIAQLAGTRRETLSVWAGRHASLPDPVPIGGVERFHVDRVLAWLEARKIPSNYLRDGEVEGATYADRVRAALRRKQTGQDARDGPAERILTELFGPLAERVCGLGRPVSYLLLLLALVLIRVRLPRDWAGVRDLVRDAVQEQRDANDVLRDIGSIADRAMLVHEAPFRVAAPLEELRPESAESVAQVVFLCEGLGKETVPLLLERYESWSKPDGDRELFTPRGVMELMADLLLGQDGGRRRCHDPYLRGGESLAAVAERVGDATLSGDSPHPDNLRIASMRLILDGKDADLAQGTAAPWNEPAPSRGGFDWILTNPPFNRKGARPRDREDGRWPFGLPPAKNQNYAWLQFVIVSLNPGGRAGVVMPNKAAVSDDKDERAIRGRMLENGAVECVIWLPSKLFAATSIGVTLWLLSAPDTSRERVLLIDARRMGARQGKRRHLSSDEWESILACYRSWKAGEEEFVASLLGGGTAVSVSIEELGERGYSLNPSDYASAVEDSTEDDLAGSWPDAALDEALTHAASADRGVRGLRVRQRESYRDEVYADRRRVSLDDLCDLKSGPTHGRLKSAARSDTGVPVVIPRHLRDRRVAADDAEQLTIEAAASLRNFALQEGDVLVVRTGTPGPVALVGAGQSGWIFDTRLVRVRRKPSAELDPEYLLAFLSLPATRTWIDERAATATAIPSIGAKALGRLPVVLPPLDEQHRIGAALRALDDQIAAHRELAETAERARATLVTGLITGPLTLD